MAIAMTLLCSKLYNFIFIHSVALSLRLSVCPSTSSKNAIKQKDYVFNFPITLDFLDKDSSTENMNKPTSALFFRRGVIRCFVFGFCICVWLACSPRSFFRITFQYCAVLWTNCPS